VQSRLHTEVSDGTESQVLLWLCEGDSSGTQEVELPPWEPVPDD
jgi:hypothetical protein